MAAAQKVFGIGFQKTGTSSLAASLYILGYDVCGYFGNDDPNIAETALVTAFEMADHYDAAQDMPWPVLYRELDQRYPGSRFILTVRDTESWIRSVVKHFKATHIDSHVWIYGVPAAAGYEAAYIERYERHNREVQAYFADRPGDLLVLDLSDGDPWSSICRFLGHDVPDVPFPRQNTKEQKLRMLPRRVIDAAMRRLRSVGGPQTSDPDPQRADSEINMAKRVTADVVRETAHLHFDSMTALVAQLEAAQQGAAERGEPLAEGAVEQARGLIADQAAMEREVLEAVGAEVPRETHPVAMATLEATIRDGRRVRDGARAYLANVGDLDVNRRIPGRRERVWQAFVQMQHDGAERRARLRFTMESMGIASEPEPYVDLRSAASRRRQSPAPTTSLWATSSS